MTGAFDSAWGGQDVDLTDNTVSEGMPVLKDGIYDTKSAAVELKDGKNGKMLIVVFQDDEGRGQITFNFNYIHSSEEAQRIGRDQMKTWLTHGGHPDPNKPFAHGKEAMIGLPVRIVVENDGTYVKNNKTRISYAIKRFMPVDPRNKASGPSAATVAPATAPGGSSPGLAPGLDDEIPF